MTTLTAMRNWFQGCKIVLITHPKPCNGYSFFPHFLSFLTFFILIFMNLQMRLFSFRPMTSIHLSYDITGSIAKCHNYIVWV